MSIFFSHTIRNQVKQKLSELLNGECTDMLLVRARDYVMDVIICVYDYILSHLPGQSLIRMLFFFF